MQCDSNVSIDKMFEPVERGCPPLNATGLSSVMLIPKSDYCVSRKKRLNHNVANNGLVLMGCEQLLRIR